MSATRYSAGDRPEASEIAGRNVSIDDDLREVRRREVERGVPDDRDDGNDHLPAIRTQIREQPPHQAAVVGFAEDVIVDHDAFSSSSSNCLR